MILSARKQYYLGFWDFLELKSLNILIKTGLYFRHAMLLKIEENDSAHELAKMLQASSKLNFIILFYFDDLHLQII